MRWFAKANKRYVSEEDKFLQKFDQDNPERSDSQKAEIAKYAEIGARRDYSLAGKKPAKDLWA